MKKTENQSDQQINSDDKNAEQRSENKAAEVTPVISKCLMGGAVGLI